LSWSIHGGRGREILVNLRENQMKRRRAIQTLAGISVAGALPLPASPQQTSVAPNKPTGANQPPNETPKLDSAVAEAAAESVPRLFSSAQFGALGRLAELLMPAAGENPGAKEAGVAEFLDFLIGASPADRQTLYREGLDKLNVEARNRYGKHFAETTGTEAGTILAPLRRAWTDESPEDPLARFLQAAKQDVMEATLNSREWSVTRAKRSRRAGSLGMYWYPIE